MFIAINYISNTGLVWELPARVIEEPIVLIGSYHKLRNSRKNFRILGYAYDRQ
jgi:hypothetical protein